MRKFIVIFAALSLLLFGIAGLVSPVGLLEWFGLPLSDDAGLRTELRAMYGGLFTALGCFLLGAALSGHLRTGAWLTVAIFGGLGIARLIGIFIDGSGTAIMFAALGFELILAALALLGLKLGE